VLCDSDLIICGNNEARDIISPFNFKNIVLPQVGIDESIFKPPENLGEFEFKNRKTELLYVGRNVPEKGVYVLKEVANKLAMKLTIVSDAEYFQLPDIYRDAKIFVSIPFTTPVWKEQSCGYTNLEAMACGVPVISSKCGAIPEYLKDSAMLIDEGSVSQLVEYISDFKGNDKVCIQIAKFGRDFILKNYTNTVIAKKLMEVFNEIHWG